MGLNITHTMDSFQFENREALRNAAKDILNRNGASQESMQKIIDKSVFDTQNVRYPDSQLAIYNASYQIGLDKKLRETLKYLKNNAPKKSEKAHVLGELWNLFNNETNTSNENFDDIEIDYSIDNIFAAA